MIAPVLLLLGLGALALAPPAAQPRVEHQVDPAVAAWLPSEDLLLQVEELVSGPVRVRWLPRWQLPHVWTAERMGERHGVPFPGLYAFRAFARGSAEVVIFVDELETPDSLLWLLLHELAHTEVARSQLLDRGLADVPRHSAYWRSDEAHDAHPEERLADLMAERWTRKLGRQGGYGRPWWRARVHASGRG